MPVNPNSIRNVLPGTLDGFIQYYMNDENDNLNLLATIRNTVVNVANAAARPANPETGMLIVQSDDNTIYRYTGTEWTAISAQATGQGLTVVANEAARPATPEDNQIIYQIDTNSLYYWDGTEWGQIGASVDPTTVEATFNGQTRTLTVTVDGVSDDVVIPGGTDDRPILEELRERIFEGYTRREITSRTEDGAARTRVWMVPLTTGVIAPVTGSFIRNSDGSLNHINFSGGIVDELAPAGQALRRDYIRNMDGSLRYDTWSIGAVVSFFTVTYRPRNIQLTGSGSELVTQNGRTVTFPDTDFTVNGRTVTYTGG